MKKNSYKSLDFTGFVSHLLKDIETLENSPKKQERSNARIKQQLLKLFVENVDKSRVYNYLETKNGFIREDFITNAITSRYKNVHIFASNPPYITQYENSKNVIYIILKRTMQGVYRVPAKNVIDVRLSLATLPLIEGLEHFEKLENALMPDDIREPYDMDDLESIEE